jgi:hypothetical protein
MLNMPFRVVADHAPQSYLHGNSFRRRKALVAYLLR